MSTESFTAFYVVKDNNEQTVAQCKTLTTDDLPRFEGTDSVLIEVEYSSLNYKDALASQGHPGVVSKLPHVPGIDCAGKVVESASNNYRPGQQVLVTGYGLGSESWGGYSRFVRVPAEWVVPLPPGLTTRSAMVLGTAGFTAAQSVLALLQHGIEPGDGPVLVSGATGGVGILAVALLAKQGYEVAAVTGKADQHAMLKQLGAKEVLTRDDITPKKPSPLQKARWAGVIDTVGGAMLVNLLAQTHYRGCVTACGLVAGPDLATTVYPFILRGITLCGIDSAKCPRGPREEVWQFLSGDTAIELPEELIITVHLDELGDRIEQMLNGQVVGRTLVVPEVG